MSAFLGQGLTQLSTFLRAIHHLLQDIKALAQLSTLLRANHRLLQDNQVLSWARTDTAVHISEGKPAFFYRTIKCYLGHGLTQLSTFLRANHRLLRDNKMLFQVRSQGTCEGRPTQVMSETIICSILPHLINAWISERSQLL